MFRISVGIKGLRGAVSYKEYYHGIIWYEGHCNRYFTIGSYNDLSSGTMTGTIRLGPIGLPQGTIRDSTRYTEILQLVACYRGFQRHLLCPVPLIVDARESAVS